MNEWFGRTLVIAAALLGGFLAVRQEPATDFSRVIPVNLVHETAISTSALDGPAGSVDQLEDSPEGLAISGWVGRAVDAVYLVVGDTTELTNHNVLLVARPDVAATGEELYSGFSAIFTGIEESSLRCVFFEGPSGSAILWPSDHTCG